MIFWIYWVNKIHFCVCAKSLQLHPTLFNHMDCSTPGFLPCKWEGCSLPGSSVQGILQARTLEWVAMPSFREASQPRDETQVSYVSCIGRWVLYS